MRCAFTPPPCALWGIGLLFSVLFIGAGVLYYASRELEHNEYNCLNLNNQLQVQLNTRLYPVPEIVHAVSPDGQYQIVSIAAARDQRRLLLRNTQSGQYEVIKSKLAEVLDVVWSSDSEWAACEWVETGTEYHYITLVNRDGEQADRTLPGYYSLQSENFSFDHTYVAQHASMHTFDVFSVANYPESAGHFPATGYAWSPVDNRLAYVTANEVIVIDMDTGNTQRMQGGHGTRYGLSILRISYGRLMGVFSPLSITILICSPVLWKSIQQKTTN